MMRSDDVNIEASWKAALQEEFSKPYFNQLKKGLRERKASGKTIYPPGELIFNAFNTTPIDDVKVVILGQDPYHGAGEAMGLCFSVPPGKRIPPSLKNIYKEIKADIGCTIPAHGDLSKWANQGVFLLNTILTVEHKSAGSHKMLGWQTFTDAVIKAISSQRDGIVFLLWGKFAQSKIPLIEISRHHVLVAAHPSPLARNAFFGNRHFSQTNQLLSKQGKPPVDWQID